jgi:hypothetical protein
VQYWQDFDGWCASRNVEPNELSIERFCNLVQFWVTRNMTKEDLDKFLVDLSRPPTGAGSQQLHAASGSWSRESELAQFRQ